MEVKTIEYFNWIKRITINSDKLSERGDNALFFLLPCNEPIKYDTNIAIISDGVDILERLRNLVSTSFVSNSDYYALNVTFITKEGEELRCSNEMTFSRYAYSKYGTFVWLRRFIKKRIGKSEIVGLRLGMRKKTKDSFNWSYFIVLKII